MKKNIEILNQFAEKYELTFLRWIEADVADFRFYVFTLKEMRRALNLDLEFDDIR